MTSTLRKSWPALAAAALGAALLLTASLAPAMSEEEVERRLLALADELRCPTCQAISVKDSEASFSVQIKEKVRRMILEGQSDEEIKAYFVSRYGEWILRAPKKEGLGLVLWILPGLAVLVAGGWIVYTVQFSRKRRDAETAAADEPAPLSEEEQERIARDLKRFEDDDLA